MTQYPTCTHVKEDGAYCGSPALRDRKYCYYHLAQRGRRLRRARALSNNEPCPLILPHLEDLGSVQLALSEILQALAAGQLEHRTAGKMLYAIQQATTVILRVAQMKERADARGETAAAVGSARLQEYAEFERNFDVEPGIDLDLETDRAMVKAQEQAAVLAVSPTPQPGSGCPVPAKAQYTRDEAYQAMQWEIHHLRKQIRESQQELKQLFGKKQIASVSAAVDTAANTA